MSHASDQDHPPDPPPNDASDQPPDPGFRGLIGIVFVVALIVAAAILIQRARDSAALMDCAITHAPSCRKLIN